MVGEMHRDVESDDDATDNAESGEIGRRDQTRSNITAKRLGKKAETFQRFVESGT